MTPKEKAIELVDKFENYSFMDIDARISSFTSAKQCALITVNEILNNGGLGTLMDEWWQDVKKEIQKL